MVDCIGPDLLSNRKDILSEMLGDTIIGLEKYCIMDEGYIIKSRAKELSATFSISSGPYLIYLSSGLTIGILSVTRYFSLNIWTEAVGRTLCECGGKLSTKNSYFRISVTDPVYSKPEYVNFLGKKIENLVILKSKNSYFSSRPSEMGLKVVLEDGVFLFSNYLMENEDSAALIFEHQIDKPMLQDLQEIEIGGV